MINLLCNSQSRQEQAASSRQSFVAMASVFCLRLQFLYKEYIQDDRERPILLTLNNRNQGYKLDSQATHLYTNNENNITNPAITVCQLISKYQLLYKQLHEHSYFI